MTIPAEILELWQEHSSATFPKGYGDKRIKGIDLPLLDAEIASCIHMYIHTDTGLDAQHVTSLRARLIDLNIILLLLNSEELMYFNRLKEMANLILQEVER